MRNLLGGLPLIALLALPASAAAATINFEGLSDLDSVTNQFAPQGVSFSNAIVFGSGDVAPFATNNACGQPAGMLNDFETPAHSGCNVASDDGGAMRIDFSAPVSAVSGFFTYFSQLTVEAFDASNLLLGTATSSFTENFRSTGNSPNELLALSFAGIRSIVITGDPFGGSFILDDLNFTPQADTNPPATPVPEPATLSLVGLGVAGWVARKRARGSAGRQDRRDS